MKIIIFLAGKGSRMKVISNHISKSFLNFKGKIIFDNIYDQVKDLGEIIVNIKHLRYFTENKIIKKYKDIKIIHEYEEIETGGAILNMIKHGMISKNEKLLLINNDIFFDNQSLISNFINYSNNLHSDITLMITKKDNFIGYFNEGGDFNIDGQFLSKKGKKDYIFTGIQIINSNIFFTENILNNMKKFSMNYFYDRNDIRFFETKDILYHIGDLKLLKMTRDNDI